MVGKGVDARKLLEPGAMDQLLLDIAILRRTVPPVGTRLEHGREQAARGVSKLGGHTRGEELHLLERVDGGGGDLVGGPDHGAHRFLAADSIYRVPERPLALTDDVLAVDVRGGRQIQKNPERILLQNRNFDDRFALQNLACRRRLSLQQGSRRGHLDGFRHGADLQLHVDAGLLAGPQDDSLTDVALKAGGLDGKLVRPGNQVGHIVGPLRTCLAGVDELCVSVDDGDACRRHDSAGVIGYGPDNGSRAGGLSESERYKQEQSQS